MTTPNPDYGDIAYVADSWAEVARWSSEFETRGAIIQRVERVFGQLIVTMRVRKEQANLILGYQPDDDEWLETGPPLAPSHPNMCA